MSFDANKIDLFKQVNKDIHPDDEMFLTTKSMMPGKGEAFHYYFYSGGLISTRLVDWLMMHGIMPGSISALDFACGYGRFTRFFSKIFRDVVASDLDQHMLDFVEKNFGVETFRSSPDSQSFHYPSRTFDVVFCYSLFTHLNPRIWKDWFQILLNMVEENGFLVITTRSPSFASAKGDNLERFNGIAFKQINETRGRLDVTSYGQTTVDKNYVKSIASSVGGNHYIDYFPGGTFCLYQDFHFFKKSRSKV